jgi:23S rRNA (uridine2552-2'-O)-methyltransferase
MAKNKFVRAWIHQHINDHYVKSATNAGYRSRAAYKLIEIDQKYDLFKNVTRTVDLGCAPGSWSQVIRRKISPGGVIVGVDLLEIEPIHGLTFIQGDFTTDEVLAELINAIGGKVVDLVVSDMAPNLSGVRGVDQARGAYLIELVLDFAKNYLATGGKCLIKIFHGGEFSNLQTHMRELFNQVVVFKPSASRSKSSETYLLGIGKKA